MKNIEFAFVDTDDIGPRAEYVWEIIEDHTLREIKIIRSWENKLDKKGFQLPTRYSEIESNLHNFAVWDWYGWVITTHIVRRVLSIINVIV